MMNFTSLKYNLFIKFLQKHNCYGQFIYYANKKYGNNFLREMKSSRFEYLVFDVLLDSKCSKLYSLAHKWALNYTNFYFKNIIPLEVYLTLKDSQKSFNEIIKRLVGDFTYFYKFKINLFLSENKKNELKKKILINFLKNNTKTSFFTFYGMPELPIWIESEHRNFLFDDYNKFLEKICIKKYFK